MTTTKDTESQSKNPTAPPLRTILAPAPTTWASIATKHFESLTPEQKAFRQELGLPTDKPVIFSGHQATLWHAGIAAKWFAMEAVAQQASAHAAWVAVDTDDITPDELRFPVKANNKLKAETLFLQGSDGVSPGAPPFEPVFSEESEAAAAHAAPCVAAGIARTRAQLTQHKGAQNAALQVTLAQADTLYHAGSARVLYPTIVPTSLLMRTSYGQTLVRKMLEAPDALIASYNAAVKAHPQAKMAPLEPGNFNTASSRSAELPLWRITSTGSRFKVRADQLADIDPAQLAPRGMLMTAMMRTAGGDLFIHGTGGGTYDTATEHWVNNWLHTSTVAPMAVASADMYLPLLERVVEPAEVERAVWEAHHAQHTPSVLGDTTAQQQKDALVDKLRDLPRNSNERAAAFADLTALLKAYRAEHQSELAARQDEAHKLRHLSAQSKLALDRTWPIVLHEAQAVAELRGAVWKLFRADS